MVAITVATSAQEGTEPIEASREGVFLWSVTVVFRREVRLMG
jgi:hypothetical protein